MKILVISNIYPPSYVGGYELGCRDAVDALLGKGHEVLVLTSRFPEGVSRVQGHVHRKLTMFAGRPEAWKVMVRELRNQTIFRGYCRSFKPDLIFFWKIGDLSLSLIGIARELAIPSCFYVFDDWIARWRSERLVEVGESFRRRFHLPLPERALGLRLQVNELRIGNPIFASRYLQRVTEESVGPSSNPLLLPWGIDTARYAAARPAVPAAPGRLLYVGQIVPHKGVHVAIRALALARELGHPSLRLTIAGDTAQMPDYVETLQGLIRSHSLGDAVSFTGKVERERLPEVYRQHDIFIFSSLWDEPFGLTPLEAMGCGLAVIGTGTGGSGETLRDGYNALIYDRQDAAGCARCIDRLLSDRQLFDTLRENGQRAVRDQYSLALTMERLERHLQTLVSPRQRRG